MFTQIDRDEVRRLVASGAQLVEVLRAEEYERAHLPGALHIPLGEVNEKTTARLQRDRPIITYCFDFL